MKIKVLGLGCAKCKATYKVVEKVIGENNLDAQLAKVVPSLPALSRAKASCMPLSQASPKPCLWNL